jgi:FMN phosphatase YigB (HAD superfamily)
MSGPAAAGGVPETTLFIDDSAANVQGARQAGVAAEIFTNTAALQEVLTRYGVL